MALINPHINFNGNAEEAFTFYKSVFVGAFAKIIHFKDLAGAEFPVAEKEENKIVHIALPIGKINRLTGNDVPESMGTTNENENWSKIVVIAESKEEADELFNGLSAGGQIEGPIGDGPWGSYFGCFRAKYGIGWIVEFDPEYKGEKYFKATNAWSGNGENSAPVPVLFFTFRDGWPLCVLKAVQSLKKGAKQQTAEQRRQMANERIPANKAGLPGTARTFPTIQALLLSC